MIASLSLALVAAIGYTIGSLFLKVSLGRGTTGNQVNLYVNIGLALVTQPLWFFASPEIPDAPLWQPLASCGFFFIGQICTFAALARGDVSVATSLLGSKVIFVTILNAAVFQLPVSLRWWAAAITASIAVALITGGKRRPGSHSVLKTAAFSLTAALSFSMADVLVQHWGNAADEIAYVPVMFGATGVLAVFYYLVVDRKAFRLQPGGRSALSLGVLLIGLQATCVFLSIVWSGDATAANVVYASRCVWSVVAAWGAGHLMGLRDAEVGAGTMVLRLIGAILLFGSVVLILL